MLENHMTTIQIPRDSLGGQNSHRRVNGARSSRALSTIFKKLRGLDREISILDYRLRTWGSRYDPKTHARRAELDTKRKAVRMVRKGYLT